MCNLDASTAFYEKLGFTKNDKFSDVSASAMQWSEYITIMLLNHDFFKKFIADISYEVLDPDGHQWEATWMTASFMNP